MYYELLSSRELVGTKWPLPGLCFNFWGEGTYLASWTGKAWTGKGTASWTGKTWTGKGAYSVLLLSSERFCPIVHCVVLKSEQSLLQRIVSIAWPSVLKVVFWFPVVGSWVQDGGGLLGLWPESWVQDGGGYGQSHGSRMERGYLGYGQSRGSNGGGYLGGLWLDLSLGLWPQ